MTEKQLLEAVRKLAGYAGWLVYHTHDSRRSEPGFPDLVLVGHGKVVFAELKSATGTPSDEQELWLERLRETGAEAVVWTPTEWNSGEIERVLTGRSA